MSISFTRSRIAAAVSLALASTVQAQTPPDEPKTMSKISVEATEPVETPKVDRVESPKFTQPLLDTPQTIAVVSRAVLRQQGATTLSAGAAQHSRRHLPARRERQHRDRRFHLHARLRHAGLHLRRRHPRPRHRLARRVQHRAGRNRQGPVGSGLRPRRGLGLRESREQGAHRRTTPGPARRATARPATPGSPAISITPSKTPAPRCA